ncbi:hypothetical protein AVEN_100099-1 [Araneus ventricosus]|uniref:CCHC-type domain-containing protein n=1 Tax=Araneus ventricosus TaxID=182803 RepID=A0A4Y2QY05_ARAVE|nr:hypothetical protein AVEN_100099-1 [Araneus ventricosus]
MPHTDDDELPDKGINTSSTSVTSQKIPVVALSKVAGVEILKLVLVNPLLIRSCEATIESLKGKLSLLSSDLSDYKQEFKESSRINRISKVSRGGLIIEAPNTDELQALERELACVSTIEEHFDVSRPKKRFPQVVLIGVPRDVDKERFSKGLSAKNIFLCDSTNKPLFELNFSMKTRYASNWVMTVNPTIYKRLFDESGLFFEFTRLKFDNFYGIKQCKHCCKFGHTTKWCPRSKEAICVKCGLDHSSDDCSKIFCINCSENNQRQGTYNL